MRNIPPGIHPIRGILGCCFLLADDENSVVIDTGLFGEMILIRRKLKQLGLRPLSIKTILLTHGHLDQTGNLWQLKRLTGASILAHPNEQPHIDGNYPYQGVNRWCGRIEAIGRKVLGYRAEKIDCFLSDGQMLPLWGGLQVIHLPGHTLGHCGFFSVRHNLLFTGDMFASYFFKTHKPPSIWNSAPEQLQKSAE